MDPDVSITPDSMLSGIRYCIDVLGYTLSTVEHKYLTEEKIGEFPIRSLGK